MPAVLSDRSKLHAERLQALLAPAAAPGATALSRPCIVALPGSGSALAYYEFGDPRGQPMLCLHGLSLSGLVFETYQEHFLRLGVRAIAPCLLGGVYRPDPDKNAHALAGELVELLDLLGIHRVDMVGFSWGTLIELALLARAPQRIRRAAFLGAMVPSRFMQPRDLQRMKADVRLSLAMVRHAPWLHRGLMALVGRLPVAVLVDQFRDPKLSQAETRALAPGHPFHDHLARCVDECRRTGSRFFTDGWRMFLDDPGYELADLARAAADADLRFYVGENDNVHLPAFSERVVAAWPADAGDPAPRHGGAPASAVFQLVQRRGPSSLWMTPGAGRMACMLHLGEALDHLLTGGR